MRLASPDQAAPARRTLLWPIQFRVDGPWYGNYVGPDRDGARANDYGAPAPWSPVDRAAYQHDLDYYAVQEKYYKSEGNESGGTMWLKGATSLDPRLQSGLGWADLKLAIRAPAYFLQGIFDGSYGLDDFSADEKHYKFGADLAWAVAITSTHLLLATHRFGLALLGGIQDLGKAATEGIISFGKRVGGVAGTLIQGIGYAADAVLTAGVFAARIAWTAANALLGVGLVIANFFLMPVITAAAYLGAKIISAVVTVAKAIWGAIKSIGEAIGDFFSSIFVLSEAVRLAVGAGDDVRATMLAFRDGYVRHVDTDGAFLSTYTDSAPLVVAEIDRRPDAQAIWEAAYASGLEPCLSCIRSGDHATAFEHFRRMFEELCDTAGVREGSVWRVRRWKQPLILT
ncbi:MAG: hypothetical protein K8U57_28630 [Planctomycetes bacterium]|nr:hypothetical protein [Planctomycetota bacterium]